jgi:hypothetical protein
MKKTRMVLAAAATVAGLVAAAGPAQAVPPQAGQTTIYFEGRSIPYAGDQDQLVPPPPKGQNLEVAAGVNGYCEFPVKIDYISNQLERRSTTNSDGVKFTRITGWATATVTNLNSGKTLNFKVSGPGLVTAYPDGAFNLDLGGANLLWTTVKNSLTGVPQLNYTTGHVIVKVGADQVTDVFELSGKSTDVCALLA